MRNKFLFLFLGLFLISFSSAWSEDEFNNSLSTENLTFSGDENITRWLSVPEDVFLANGFLNLSGYDLMNVIAYYKLDESSGVVIDSTGVYNGTNYGAETNVTGKINKSYNFTEGAGEYTELKNIGGGAITINSWIKIFNLKSNHHYYGSINTFSSGKDGTVLGGYNTTFSLACYKDNSLGFEFGTSGNYLENTWYMVTTTLSADRKHFEIYINGIEEANLTTSTAFTSNDRILSLGFGSYTQRTTYGFGGMFDEVGIWDRVLSSNEIFTLYNNTNGLKYNNYIPTNPSIHINNTKIWNHTGEFNSTAQTSNFAETIKSYIETATAIAGYYLIPFIFHSDTAGILEYLNLIFNNEGFIENSQTYSNETAEGNIETFKINFSYDSDKYSTVETKLIYNNTEYIGAKISGTGNTVVYSADVTIPPVSADENKTFYWNILVGTTYQNSTFYNQTIYNLALDNCSVYTNKILNLTIYDEEIQNKIDASAVAVELEIAVNIYSSDRSTLALNLSEQHATNPTAICLNRNLSDSLNYSMDAVIRYESSGYENEYYNIVNLILTNETAMQDIQLYNLNSTDSTEFQLIFSGADYLPVENALVYVDRQYIAENIFKTVELPLTDTNGQTILHLVKNDVIYNFRIVKDGVVLGNFLNMIAFCEDYTIGDCKINLNAFDSVGEVFNPDIFGITFTTPTYSSTQDTISFNFVSVDGSVKTVLMEITRNDIFGNRSVCSSTLTSSSGTISCDIDPNIDESVLRINIYVDETQITSTSITIDSSNYGEAGYLVFFIMTITIILMFSGSKTGILFGIIISFATAIGLNMVNSDLIGVGASGMWLIIIVVIAIWKLNKERPQ